MSDLNLGQYFKLSEFTKSVTAKRLGLNNNPSHADIVDMLRLVQWVLDPLRHESERPIVITSGYRSKELNTAIGGSSTSQHCRGQAADIEDSAGDNAFLFDFIVRKLDFDQLIWEFGNDDQPDWIHVSYNIGKNKLEVLRAYKQEGKTCYEPYPFT